MPSSISCIHFISEVRFELGGVVQAVVDLCQALAARGDDITLVTCDDSDIPAEWRESEGNWPKVVCVESSGWSKAVGMKLLSKKGLKQFEALLSDAHLCHLHTPWELANFQLAPMLRRNNIPYVITAHGMLDDWSMQQKSFKKKLFLRLIGRSIFRKATTVHLTAEGEREQASKWVPIGDNAAVQCYALDLTAYSPPPGPGPAFDAFPLIDKEKTKLLFLSRLHPKKGVEILIKAGALLRDEGLPIQLLIVGPGDEQYLAELNALVDSLNMQQETFFLGMVRGTVKRSIFQAADIFVLPTHQENFGLAITEAMACGTPVVTTKGTDIWREIEQGGARIADHTPESFAEHLRPLCLDPELANQVGEQGNVFVRKWLDRSAVTRGYEELYRNTLEKAGVEVPSN